MGMSISYGEPDDPESIATIQRSIDLGCNLLVTSDAYGNGVNEALIARAIRGRRNAVIIATKFGNLGLAASTGGEAPRLSGGHPDYVKQACEASLRHLGVETIDLYGLHRVDPLIPIEDTVGAMQRLITEGKVRYLGLSEAGATTLRRAHAVHPITALETEYSLWSREVESEILPACRDLGVGFMAYAPLGRGFLSGTITSVDALIASDRRRDHPRFKPENINENNKLIEFLASVAATHQATPAQVAIAWVLAQGADIVPIPGTKRRTYLEANCKAVDLVFSAEELTQLAAVFPLGGAAGTRYPEKLLKGLGI
jgi:aryl-alcohol dehydrogenase-like predicted oxidoreductase